ncbi:MAG: hypothetical protein K2O18_19390, partial [Oscillospiraceae bacterium]|nr:hypothetical protein [Oscillospiraceae bacterium]
VNISDLCGLLLAQEERQEMRESLQMLKEEKYSRFYERNQKIVSDLLFLESLDEFMDFSEGDRLDEESYCFAFLCAKGNGLQIGGYEEDLTEKLTGFFAQKGLLYPEIAAIINREVIYTDCDNSGNFEQAVTEINRFLEPHGLWLTVFDDFMYCDCQYTLLLTDTALAEQIAAGWESGNFEAVLTFRHSA